MWGHEAVNIEITHFMIYTKIFTYTSVLVLLLNCWNIH